EGETAPETARRSEANHGGVLTDPPHFGKAPTDSRPWSRIGENPPYGILGRAMETSASCEARLAPSLYPTAALALSPEARAGCGNTARPDLSRGLWATMIPTQTAFLRLSVEAFVVSSYSKRSG